MSQHNSNGVHDSAERGSLNIGMKTGSGTADGFAGMQMTTESYNGGNGSVLRFYTWGANTAISREVMRINESGNVGIGITTPATKLAVNGTITTKEVVVQSSNWPDYVFKKDYHLPSLDSLSAQIQAEGHLPGMPTAAEVEKNGLSLGNIVKQQQQKIEELALYIMSLKKELEQEHLTREKEFEHISGKSIKSK